MTSSPLPASFSSTPKTASAGSLNGSMILTWVDGGSGTPCAAWASASESCHSLRRRLDIPSAQRSTRAKTREVVDSAVGRITVSSDPWSPNGSTKSWHCHLAQLARIGKRGKWLVQQMTSRGVRMIDYDKPCSAESIMRIFFASLVCLNLGLAAAPAFANDPKKPAATKHEKGKPAPTKPAKEKAKSGKGICKDPAAAAQAKMTPEGELIEDQKTCEANHGVWQAQ
jgi:hypothetical protein